MIAPEGRWNGHRAAGCAAAFAIWLGIGLPMLFVSVMGECLPRNAPTMAACDAQKKIEVLFWLIASPIVASLLGWLVARAFRRDR